MRGNYMKGYRLGISTTFSIIVFFFQNIGQALPNGTWSHHVGTNAAVRTNHR